MRRASLVVLISPLIMAADAFTPNQVCNWLGVCSQQLAVPALDGGAEVYSNVFIAGTGIDTPAVGTLSGPLNLSGGNGLMIINSTIDWLGLGTTGGAVLSIDGGYSICFDTLDAGCIVEVGNVLTIKPLAGGALEVGQPFVVDAGETIWGPLVDHGTAVFDAGIAGSMNTLGNDTISGNLSAHAFQGFQSDSITYHTTLATFTGAVASGGPAAGYFKVAFDGGEINTGAVFAWIDFSSSFTYPDAGFTVDCTHAPLICGATCSETSNAAPVNVTCVALDGGAFGISIQSNWGSPLSAVGWDGGNGSMWIQYNTIGW